MPSRPTLLSANRVRFGSFEKRAYLETVRIDSRTWQVIGSPPRTSADRWIRNAHIERRNAVVATPGSCRVVLLRTSDLTRAHHLPNRRRASRGSTPARRIRRGPQLEDW